MELKGLAQPASLTLTAEPTAIRAWRVGQVLDAVVVSSAPDGRATLRIEGTLVQAQTTVALSAGQPLHLKVVTDGGQPVLKVVQPAVPPAAPPATDAATLTQALRAALPRQQPLGPLLADLSALVAQTGSKPQGVPAPIVELARGILAQLPTAPQASTPDGLKRALRQSGTFLEAGLARPPAASEQPPAPADLKAGLLRLVAELRTQTPVQGPANPISAASPSGAPALLDKIEGALARIQANQLNSLVAETTDKPAWLVDLPVRQGDRVDVFRLRVEEDRAARRGEAESAPWSVWLDFDLAGLGCVRAQVRAQGESVSASFWTEQDGAAALFSRHMDVLHRELTAAGLSVGQLAAQAGAPAWAPADPTVAGLLNEKA